MYTLPGRLQKPAANCNEIEDLCKYSNEINSTGGVMAKVASTVGAIGYVSLDVLDDSKIGDQKNRFSQQEKEEEHLIHL